MDAHAEDIKHHVKIYVGVFIALLVLTVVTVGVSYLHLPVHLAVALALVVAAIKGTLVAGYFMHLLTEKKIVLWVLALTVVFFIVLLLLPILTDVEVYRYVRRHA